MDLNSIPSQLRFKPIQQYLNRKTTSKNDIRFFQQYSVQTYFVKEFQTDIKKGLSAQSLQQNKRKYGENIFKKKQLKTLCQFFYDAITDEMLLILIVAAIISIVLEYFYADEKSMFWVDGVSILFAVAVCSVVAAVNDYQKQKQFQQLNNQTQSRDQYQIIRQGQRKIVKRDEIVVGDLVIVEGGLQMPVDGFLVQAINLIVDESSITGESHEVYKDVQSKCITQIDSQLCPSPVILGGSKILSGQGKMICSIVGQHSQMGKLNELINQQPQEEEEKQTPLEIKLQALASKISYFGIFSAIFIFIALCIKYLINDIIPDGWSMNDLGQILKFIVIAVTIIVVAVPQGLPLAVTLSLAFSVKQMQKENNLVRQIMSCETMGGANFICTDKTGTLTLNKMSVIQVWSGQKKNFSQFKKMGQLYQLLFLNSIFHNTSAHIRPYQKGSQTEVALLKFAQSLFTTEKYDKYRERAQQSGYFLRLPFNSSRKRMTTGISIDNNYYVLTKGASQAIIENCQDVLLPNDKSISLNKVQLKKVIEEMASKGLRTVAVAAKKVSHPINSGFRDRNRGDIQPIQQSGFSLLFIAGIKDTCRPQIVQSIQKCKSAGVNVIMVTGDNLITANSIAKQVGIIEEDDQQYCIDGEKFDMLLKKGQINVEKIKVLARSKPEHKFKLVSQLKKLQNVVAVTGDGTNDGPALIKADVGLAMGIAGTQLAKKAADIILLDDNFSSIIRAIVWGRNIYDSIRKFLQFQLTVNLVAVGLSIISSVIVGQSVLTAVQMLWINLIMDSLASLALATQSPNSETLLNRNPHSKRQSLISTRMIKHVIGQAILQFTILIALLFFGQHFIPQYPDKFDQIIGSDLGAKYYNGQQGGTVVSGNFYEINGKDAYYLIFSKYHIYSRHFTFIFNTFVFLQVFNFFNCRKIHDEIINYLEGIHKNYLFLILLVIIVGFQIVIVELLPTPFKLYSYGLTIQQWFLSVGIASLSIPFSLLLRMFNIGKEANEQIDPNIQQSKKEDNESHSQPKS